MTNRLKIVGVIVTISLVATIITVSLLSHRTSSEPVASVDGIFIMQDEFEFYLNAYYVAETYSYYNREFGIEPTEDFWTSIYDNGTPLDYIHNQTLTYLTKIKTELGLMQEAGVLVQVSFDQLQLQWREENKNRSKAFQQGKPIYGPIEYGLQEYIEYLISNGKTRLKEKWISEGVISVTDQEINDRYKLLRTTNYKYPDRVVIEYMEWIYSDEDEKVVVNMIVENLLNRWKSGMGLETLLQQQNVEGNVIKRVFDETTTRYDEQSFLLRETAYQLDPDLSVVTLDTGHGLYLIRCIERENERFMMLDDIESQIRSELFQIKYDELVSKEINNAELIIYDEIIHKVFPI
ncbi:hypothetical protein [Paenibacillus endoradicis]|uniref:hypothetical protein n=1 Tax=Paenibacillus endoradicis TaxID=2972487 RepID=UPI00215932C8|nr:hypothetical protein [Paenibacillus endoradicis]MCR8657108.1 hypothetical protein [Paenibacillus endoradicis]